MAALAKWLNRLGNLELNDRGSGALDALIQSGVTKINSHGYDVHIIEQSELTFTQALDGVTDTLMYAEATDKLQAGKSQIFSAAVPNTVTNVSVIGIIMQFALTNMTDDTDKASFQTDVDIMVKKGSTATIATASIAKICRSYVSHPMVYSGALGAIIYTEPTMVLFEDAIPFSRDEPGTLNFSFTHIMTNKLSVTAFATACTYTHKLKLWIMCIDEEKSAGSIESIIAFLKSLSNKQ